MKFLFTIISFCLIINIWAQQKKTAIEHQTFLKRIFAICYSIQEFENKFESNHSADDQDSVYKYNDSLTLLLSKFEIRNLSASDLLEISDSTRITIRRSRDEKLQILSWCVFQSSPAPMCSDIAVFQNNHPKILSNNGTENGDSGLNIKVDSILTLKEKGRSSYLVLGSNGCGNLCLDYVAVLYSVQNGEIFQKKNSFFDGKRFSDQVEFNYLQNEKINNEPKFKIKNRQLVCPIFNNDRTRLIGRKNFAIVL